MPPQSAKSSSQLSRVEEHGIQAESKKKKKEMTQAGCQSLESIQLSLLDSVEARGAQKGGGGRALLKGVALAAGMPVSYNTEKNKNKFKFVPDKREKKPLVFMPPGARESHHVGVSSRRWTYTLQVAA